MGISNCHPGFSPAMRRVVCQAGFLNSATQPDPLQIDSALTYCRVAGTRSTGVATASRFFSNSRPNPGSQSRLWAAFSFSSAMTIFVPGLAAGVEAGQPLRLDEMHDAFLDRVLTLAVGANQRAGFDRFAISGLAQSQLSMAGRAGE
jgi:hypothetical protein